MDCIFCKIIRKEVPADIFYEDNELIGFKNINPEAPVHLLLVPKTHIEWLQNFSEEDKQLIGKLMTRAQKIIKEHSIDPACKFIFNVGKTGHVVHIHLHILGGWEKEIPMHNI